MSFFSRLRGYNDGTARGRGDKARVVESILIEHAVFVGRVRKGGAVHDSVGYDAAKDVR